MILHAGVHRSASNILKVMNNFVKSGSCVKDTPLSILLLCQRNASIKLKIKSSL